MRSSTHTLSRSLPVALAALALTAAQASAQTTFSIDAKGPTFLAPSCGFGAPIFPDDILGVRHPSANPAPGVLPAPRVVIPAGPGGLGLAPLGTFYDVAALSYAADGPATPAMPRGSVWFSLRRESTALPTPFPPSAATELAIAEGAADLFIDVGLLPGPLPPALGGNTLAVDANGVPSPGILGNPSLGLIEPHGVCVPGFDPGDNLDALDIAVGLEQDCNGNGVPDRCEFTQGTYCPTGTTSNGCNPSISGAGVPSASLSCAYQIDVSNVDGQRAGILFYGVNGPIAAPWACGGSMLCVKAPTQRTGGQTSGGTLNNCDGTLTLDFNNYMATHPLAVGQPLFAGENFYFQGWFRDSPCGKATTHLSDALRFSLAP